MDDEIFKRVLDVRALTKCGAGIAAQREDGAKVRLGRYLELII